MDCIFCGPTEAPRAKEHVFPDWMLTRYAWVGHYIQPTRFGTNGELLSQRTHVMGGMLAGGVCADCNGGWMAALETDNMNLIAALVDGTLNVSEVEAAARLPLARWLTKTAYVLHSCANWRRVVPAKHFRDLRSSPTTLPERGVVLAKSIRPSDSVIFWQTTNWLAQSRALPFSPDEAKSIHDHAYKISLQIGAFVATVACCPVRDVHYCAASQVHELVAPEGAVLEWHSDNFAIPDNPQAFAMASNFMLSVMRGEVNEVGTS